MKHTFSSWIPYTGLQITGQKYPDQFVGKVGKGKKRTYKDLSCMYWSDILGWGHPRIRAAIVGFSKGDLFTTVNFGITDEPREKLAREIKKITEMDENGSVISSSAGGLSLDHAIRASWQYQKIKGRPKREGIIRLRWSYHGCTGLTLSAGYFPIGKEDTNINTRYIPEGINKYFITVNSPEEAASLTVEIKKVLAQREDVAAVLIEPVQNPGATQPTEEYYKGLQGLLKEEDILLIVDEVATFARFGRGTAAAYFGLKPDILVLGKALSNGTVPLSACVISEKVHQGLEGDLIGGNNYFGDTLAFCPLSTAIGLATLRELRREEQGKTLMQRGLELHEEIRERLTAELKHTPVRVEGIGGMTKLVFPSDIASKRATRKLLKKGYFANRTRNKIYIATRLVPGTTDFEKLAQELKTG